MRTKERHAHGTRNAHGCRRSLLRKALRRTLFVKKRTRRERLTSSCTRRGRLLPLPTFRKPPSAESSTAHRHGTTGQRPVTLRKKTKGRKKKGGGGGRREGKKNWPAGGEGESATPFSLTTSRRRRVRTRRRNSQQSMYASKKVASRTAPRRSLQVRVFALALKGNLRPPCALPPPRSSPHRLTGPAARRANPPGVALAREPNSAPRRVCSRSHYASRVEITQRQSQTTRTPGDRPRNSRAPDRTRRAWRVRQSGTIKRRTSTPRAKPPPRSRVAIRIGRRWTPQTHGSTCDRRICAREPGQGAGAARERRGAGAGAATAKARMGALERGREAEESSGRDLREALGTSRETRKGWDASAATVSTSTCNAIAVTPASFASFVLKLRRGV